MTMNLFITGTDTHVGKTFISVGLLKAFNRLGFSTIGLKPIASGCFYQNGQLYNEDALSLLAHASLKLDYADINPFAFVPPIAPHIAAKKVNISLTVEYILQKLNKALATPADLHLIEGVGGWLVPLNQHETMADLVNTAKWPVMIVIAIRLGCLNHALLTLRAIKAANIPIIGWIANCLQSEEQEIDAIIDTLTEQLSCPYLARIPYQGKVEDYLDASAIVNYYKKQTSLAKDSYIKYVKNHSTI